MVEAEKFINNGMHIIHVFKLILDAFNTWSSICHLIVVFDFLVSVFACDLCLTCHV